MPISRHLPPTRTTETRQRSKKHILLVQYESSSLPWTEGGANEKRIGSPTTRHHLPFSATSSSRPRPPKGIQKPPWTVHLPRTPRAQHIEQAQLNPDTKTRNKTASTKPQSRHPARRSKTQAITVISIDWSLGIPHSRHPPCNPCASRSGDHCTQAVSPPAEGPSTRRKPSYPAPQTASSGATDPSPLSATSFCIILLPQHFG